MTNEELVELYQGGDNNALDQLIEKNSGLIHTLARKFYTAKTASIDYEDLFQEGNIGLITAANKYNLKNEKKAVFSTYATYWIRQKIQRFIEQKNTNEEISLNSPVGENGAELGDFIVDEMDYFCSVEDTSQLREELIQVMHKVLNLRQRQLLEIRYGFDQRVVISMKKHYGGWGVYSFREMATIFGVSPQRVMQIESEALKKMRLSEWGKNKYKEQEVQRGTLKKVDTDSFFDMITQSIITLEV